MVPLAFSTGAGAVARQIMGTAVMGGMTAASVIAIFLIPVTFYVVQKLSRGKKEEQAEKRGTGGKKEETMRNVIISSLFTLTLFGCMIGPNYQRPALETPPSWRFEEKEAREIANTAWWEQFDDPVLNELIQIALKENKDVKIAAARVEEFTGRYGTTRAALFPQMGAGASAGRSRST